MSTDDPTPALSLPDRWRRSVYLHRVALWLDPMPRKRRNQVLGELRANLQAAAREEGMTAAIDDLGPPRVLARQYLQTEPQGRPTWHHGAIAVGGALMLWILAFFAYVIGSFETLLAAGVSDPVDITFLGTELTTEAHEERIGVTFTVFWPALLVFVVIFLLFARVWRLFRRSSADDDAAQRERERA